MRSWYGLLIVLFLITVSQKTCNSQNLSRENARLLGIGITGTVAYGGALVVMNNYWYKNYPRSAFHFFNDNDEWEQMDKAGHCFTSYYEGYLGLKMMQWAGLPKNKAIWYGGTWGLLLQTPVEILDGFSTEWGFSWGDALANTLGTAMLISQEYAFGYQRFQPKFSYFPTEYAAQNPQMFGNNLPENMIKDYNGQNYWVATPLNTLYQNKYIPTWFTISIGFGARGMLRGSPKDQENDPKARLYKRYKQVFISLDVNLAAIDTRNEFGNTALTALSWIKTPSPTLEYSRYRGLKGYLLYY